jgi:hypothetical protein
MTAEFSLPVALTKVQAGVRVCGLLKSPFWTTFAGGPQGLGGGEGGGGGNEHRRMGCTYNTRYNTNMNFIILVVSSHVTVQRTDVCLECLARTFCFFIRMLQQCNQNIKTACEELRVSHWQPGLLNYPMDPGQDAQMSTWPLHCNSVCSPENDIMMIMMMVTRHRDGEDKAHLKSTVYRSGLTVLESHF